MTVSRRFYVNVAPPLSLAAQLNAGAVSAQVSSTAGYPAVPFTISIDRGSNTEEVILVGAVDATHFLSLTRGFDGTTDQTHVIGTPVEHVVCALDYNQANLVALAVLGNLPAYTTTARDALTDPPNVIYNTTLSRVQVLVGGVWTSVRLDAGTTVRVAWTYTLPTEIKIPSGSTDYLPRAPISVPSGQGVTLVGYKWISSFGTSFTFKMVHYTGSTLATTTDLVTSIVAAASSVKGSGTFGTPKVCADNDAWAPVITGVSGTPIGGSISIVADITI